MKRVQRRRILIAAGALPVAPQGALSAVADSIVMMTLIGGAEIFLPRTRLGRTLGRLPFRRRRSRSCCIRQWFWRWLAAGSGRAALHAGEVVTGEVGGSRRFSVFHGDVMNTTARIENATPDLGRPFPVSVDALARLSGASRG